MSVAKVTEVIASSDKSFDDAVKNGISRASKTLEGIRTAWVKEQSVVVEDSEVKEFRVNLKLTFVLKD